MKRTYLYNETEYYSERQVRQAIWQSERKAFGVTPTENVAEFWKQFNVTYTETEETISLDVLKVQKNQQLENNFLEWRNDKATVTSSLGFVIDADSRAMQDVSGLVTLAGSAEDGFTLDFMDTNNETHSLTLENLLTIQKEIIQSGIEGYKIKWAKRELIKNATSEEELNNIDINFN